MIYIDACALVKFVRLESETAALRSWRSEFDPETELLTSELSRLEITRALWRAGVDPQRIPYFAGQALKGTYVMDVSSTVLARAAAYQVRRLGSLDAIHLASADPFRTDLSAFVTYDKELMAAATDLGFPVTAPA